MPSELDPAYGNYLPSSQWDETPTQGMKRIEAAMAEPPERYNTQRGRLAAGAGRSLEGYNARVGAQGPVGGGVMVAADPLTGQPVMVAGQAQAGPLSYQYSKPTVRGAPASQQIGVGGQPFDADAYFGVSAQQGPGGRTYGANVSQGSEDGGWSAYGGYNPTTKGVNVGGSYQTNFATGGRASVGHTTAAGLPVTLETRKGDMRQREDSGASRMAADYGYLDTSRPDHDGMKTDAFVGPHRDSKKVFVVNQQHPHTGKFNEHKVLLGYKDRAHALRDYAHSFSDGLGHKRIHSVVEMGTHELKDWLKKPHTEPLKKAEGGPVDEPRPLTIRRGVTPQGLAAEMVPPEEQSPIEGRQAASPSPEGVTSALQGIAEGVGSLYSTPQADAAYTTAPPAPVRRPITPQMIAASLNPEAQGAASPSLEGLGQGMVAMGEDPVGLIGGMLPGIGNVLAAADVSKLKDKIAELRASGDEEGATRLQKILPLAAMGAVMPMGAGAATKAAIKGAEKGAAKAAERELSSMGLYSHAAEVADALPQAKGSPQQMKAMLKGVKEEELAGFDAAFGDKKSVTKDEIAQHFRDQMPVVEETVLGGKSHVEFTPEMQQRLNDLTDKRVSGGLTESEMAEKNQLYNLEQEARSGRSKPKFGQYTLPGGENYREVLLKMPEKSFGRDDPRVMQEALMAYNEKSIPNLSDAQWKMLQARAARRNGETLEQPFKSSHWDDPNVLAHLRLADRIGPNGEKILHVEEIQSDWAQKAREIRDEEVKRVMEKQGVTKEEANNLVPSEFGFKPPRDPMMKEKLNAAEDAYNEAANSHQEMLKQINQSIEKMPDPRTVSPGEYNRAQQAHEAMRQDVMRANPDFEASANRVRQASQDLTSLREQQSLFDKSEGVPTGPYVGKTPQWTDLALKRALREAAEGGYDKLVWTPGAEQAKRYSLSNQVDRLQYIKNDNGTYAVIPYKNNRPLHRIERDNIPDKELESLFGRDVAEKMRAYEGDVDGNARSLSGQNLEVGGSGMKGYYDKIVPKRLQELIKKHDPEAKIGTHEIRTTKESDLRRKLRDQGYDPDEIEVQELLSDNGGRAPRGFTEADLDAMERGEHFGGVSQKGVTAPSLTITPKMRESILKGQTAFAEGGEVEAPAKGGAVAPTSFPEQVSLVAHDIARIAHKDRLDQRHLAYLLKVASGTLMPPERAMEFAGQIMTGDTNGLMQRFQTYIPSARTFARLNEMLGGKHDFMGSGHMGKNMQRMKGVDALQRTKDALEAAMDSDVVRDRPAMSKALKRLSKRI